jgi:hypothetical protein
MIGRFSFAGEEASSAAGIEPSGMTHAASAAPPAPMAMARKKPRRLS